MAPTMAIADPRIGWPGQGLVGLKKKGNDDGMELRRRNEELEREVRERREREAELRRELDRMRDRLRSTEEAEERLVAQLGELEAEAVAQARDYHRRITALQAQLGRAQKGLVVAGGDGSG